MVSENMYTYMNTTKIASTIYVQRLYCKGAVTIAPITVTPYTIIFGSHGRNFLFGML